MCKKILTVFTVVVSAFLFTGLEGNSAIFPKYNPNDKDLKPGFYKLGKTHNVHDLVNGVRLNDSRIFIWGGGDMLSNDKSTEVFDFKTLKFSKTAVPNYNHYDTLGAVVLGNGNVLMRSDNDDDINPVSYFELYDPVNNKFIDTKQQLNATCFGYMYATSNGNATVYCRQYGKNKSGKSYVYESMNIFDHKTNKFLKPLKPGEKGYRKHNNIANAQDENIYIHPDEMPFLHLPDKKMFMFFSVEIPKDLRNLKTYDDIMKNTQRLLPYDGTNSKKVYAFVYNE